MHHSQIMIAQWLYLTAVGIAMVASLLIDDAKGAKRFIGPVVILGVGLLILAIIYVASTGNCVQSGDC